MASAKERDSDDRSRRMDRTAWTSVLGESEMVRGAIAIVGVGFVDPAQMGFARNQDVVEAFSSDRADERFNVSSLPG
jgi:hypothetical protein